MDDLQKETAAREQMPASLTARDRDLVEQVLHDHRSLTPEKALAVLRAARM